MKISKHKQKHYNVFSCYHCRQWQYCNTTHKTHRCTYCSKRLLISRIKPTFETDDINEAIKFIQEIKRLVNLKKGGETFVTAEELLHKEYDENCMA